MDKTDILEEFTCYQPLEAPSALSISDQIEMYFKMNLIRVFDTKVKELWMENRIYGLAHSYVGAEAIAVGACMALEPQDIITSTIGPRPYHSQGCRCQDNDGRTVWE